MTRRAVGMVLLGLGVLVAALGIGRLRLDTDVLGMLPQDMPEVRGLSGFHRAFAREDELVILLEGGEQDEGLMAEHAESLARALESAGAAKRARWQPLWMEEGGGMAELLAYLWLNGSEDSASRLAAELAPANRAATLEKSLAGVGTALEGADLVMRAHDPFGFLNHPAIEALLGTADEGAAGFESADGRRHLILADAPRPVHGYREAGVWLDETRAVIEAWRKSNGGGPRVFLTGEPAFSSEIGGAMEKDMRGTVGITSALIALLFWLMQRRLVLLGGLVGTLALVFVAALGLAGWIYGELSIMAAGFAAILIGLAVDYGVLICQESKLGGGDVTSLRRATTGSVAWAAATTAVVFLALNFSGLPGIAQLGTMVACGIAAGAVLMLGYYLPFVARAGGARVVRPGWNPVPGVATARMLTLAVLLTTVASLAWKGFPGIGFDSRMMRPRHSEAMHAFERVRDAFPQWNTEAVRVVVEAPDDARMRERAATAEKRLAENPAVASWSLPAGWWPHPQRQQANRALLQPAAEDAEALLAAADEAGFTGEGQALGRQVLAELRRMLAESGDIYPKSAAALEMTRLFVSRDPRGGGCLVGTLETAPGDNYQTLRRINGDGIWLAGWDLLRPAVAPLVRKDLTDVFLPMAGLMVLMLAVMFRSAREVVFCIGAMALSGLILLAAMAWLGIGWNFLNIAATPLLLGTGIDYGIHVGLALRRNGGDVAGMWHGTGKAVLFCGASTAIGFGSLCFASNDAMASLGAVAVIGILASMLVSVFLLPAMIARQR